MYAGVALTRSAITRASRVIGVLGSSPTMPAAASTRRVGAQVESMSSWNSAGPGEFNMNLSIGKRIEIVERSVPRGPCRRDERRQCATRAADGHHDEHGLRSYSRYGRELGASDDAGGQVALFSLASVEGRRG